MEECSQEISKILRSFAKKPDENTVAQVARISSNGDEEIVNLVTQAYQTTSSDTVVTVEEASGVESHVEFTKGFKLKAGLKSPYFINNQSKEICEMENALLFINNGEYKTYTDVVPVIEQAIERNKPLLFVGKGFGQEAQNTIVYNVVKAGLNVAFIELQEHGNLKENVLKDLALLTGGEAYVHALHGNLENIDFDVFFGSCKKIEVGVYETTIVEGSGDQALVDDLLGELKKALEECSQEQKPDLKERVARLAGSVSVIKVGARTEMEVKEKVDRVEDAINAVKAGLKEGVVAGGGAALIHASLLLKETGSKGQTLVEHAVLEPFVQLCSNCDLPDTSIDEILDELMSQENTTLGYNFKTDTVVDFVEQGIVDPVLVVINSLESAVSVAGLLLTTEVAMVNERVEV
jgi:chaperonin GroEL